MRLVVVVVMLVILSCLVTGWEDKSLDRISELESHLSHCSQGPPATNWLGRASNIKAELC